MTNIIFGIVCILAVPLGIGILVGWLMWGRDHRAQVPPPTANRSHRDWLDDEFRRPPMRGILTQSQINELRVIYGITQPPQSPESAEGPVNASPLSPAPSGSEAVLDAPAPAGVPDLADALASPADPDADEHIVPNTQPVAPPRSSRSAPAGTRSPFAPPAVPAHTPPPRAGLGLPSIQAPRVDRTALDPAALMLYLGAFLVVAAGIVYASYNWADLGSGQKLGLLAAVTLAFGGTGIALLSNSRVRQAAETFIAISALLVPANAIAAWSVLDSGDASIPVITLVGALVTTVVYVAYSIRPGGRAYAYGAAIAAMVSIGALLPAFGTHVGWSGPTLLLATALIVLGSSHLPKAALHLATPFRHVAIAVLPLATALGIAASTDTTEWLGPITLVAATAALLALAYHHPHPAWSALSTFSLLAGVAWSVIIIDPPSSWVLMGIALVVGAALVAFNEIAPAWFGQRNVSHLLHAEAIVALLVAVTIPIGNENAWQMMLGFAMAAAISASIPILGHSRLWLLATASFAAGVWFSIAGIANGSEWPEWSRHLYIAGSVVALALAAYVLDRWSERTERPSWGFPFWVVGGVIAMLHTISTVQIRLLSTDDLPGWAASVAFVGYALVAFVAAWSLDRAMIRALSGVWLILASVMAVDALDLMPEDRSSALFLLLGGLIAACWFGTRHANDPPRAWLGPRREDDPRLEVPVLAIAAGLTFLGMMAIALRYIATVQEPITADLPGVVWTWIVYVATFATVTLALAGVGYVMPQPSSEPTDDAPPWKSPGASLSAAVMLLTALTLLLALRMATTDLVTWTLVGLGFGLLLVALPIVPRIADNDRWFMQGLAAQGPYAGAGVLIASLLANIGLTYSHDIAREAGVSAVAGGLVAVALLAIGLRGGNGRVDWLGFGTGTFAVLQATRAFTDSDRMIVLALAIFAWVVMGAALALPNHAPLAGHRPPWRLAALAIGTLAAIAPATNLVSMSTSDDDLQIVVLALVSLAGLLAVDAVLAKDRLRGVIASAIAMTALLLQITLRDPENILVYTIPVGVYLLALGYVQRQHAPYRDALLIAGSGALLVPALLLAQTEGSLGYLWLAGGLSLALFLIGVALQLRVLIAAGVIGVTIIVMRMLVEAALALESWITLLVIGMVLLGGGTASLIWKEALLARLERLQQSWHDMA